MGLNETALAFLNRLQEQNLKPSKVYEAEENSVVVMGVSGQYAKYDVMFFFQPKNFVQIMIPELATVSGDKRLIVLEKLNDLNFKYSWLKFILDPKNKLHILADAAVTPETAGDVCMQFLTRAILILDDIYPELMHAVWY